jgi:threonine dehydratase
MGLKTKIVGVVAEEAPAYSLSFAARRAIAAPVTTLLADGMACRVPDEEALDIILKNVDRIVTVSEQEIADAMRVYFTDTHNVVEGAGAAGLAAAIKEKPLLRGATVGLVASGGNVDRERFASVLAD